jgi:hypothetical protein
VHRGVSSHPYRLTLLAVARPATVSKRENEERQKAQSGAKMAKFRHFCSRLRFLPFLVFHLQTFERALQARRLQNSPASVDQY